MKTKIITAIIVIALIVPFVLCGCRKGEKYNVDYNGKKELFRGAKNSYREGEKVKFYFDFIATDTDYKFYLDGDEKVDVEYNSKRNCFVISFIMPSRDVKFEFDSTNTMEHYAPQYEAGTILFDYYEKENTADDNNGYYELVLTATEDAYKHRLDVYKKTADSQEEYKSYSVWHYAYDDCYSVITVNNADEWNELQDGVSLDGKLIVVKFFDGSELVEISSEKMDAQTGETVLNILKSTLEGYISEDSLIIEE